MRWLTTFWLHRKEQICFQALKSKNETSKSLFVHFKKKKKSRLTDMPTAHHLTETSLTSDLKYGCMWEAENATVGVSLQARL